MAEFKFITANESYGNLYYQLPRVLFTSDFYKEMSNDSKIAYAMLQDRFEYSLKNNWIDENNNVYFIFTRDELMDILRCKENKIAKIKKELKEKNLLFEKRTPPKKLANGTFETFPNKLYLGKLEVTAQDVYSLSESGKNQFSGKAIHINENSESGKNQFSDKPLPVLGSSESGKNHPNLYRTSLDTLKEDTKEIDTDKTALPIDPQITPVKEMQDQRDALREMDLLQNFADMHAANSFLSYNNLKIIGMFSNSLKDAEEIQGIILRAKKKVEKERNQVIVVDESYIYDESLDIQGEIGKALRRIYHKRQTDSTINNIDNYAFGSFKNLFDTLLSQWQKINNSEINKESQVTLHDWTEFY